MPFEGILNNGVLKINENEYVKIIKVEPINFYLKNQIEQEMILNSYKIFLKTCNFEIQILIQSKNENLEKNIFHINSILEKEKNNKLFKIKEKYFNYIINLNKEKKATSKNFYIIIKENRKINNAENEEKNVFEELENKFLKIKESLNYCGNKVNNLSNKEIKEILFSFYNIRKYLNK